MNILAGIPEEKLTLEQESEIATQEDKAALVLHNLREAFYYAKGTYQSRGLDDGELLSVCYAALLAASNNFRPGQIRFFAFAKAHVRGALSKAKRAHKVVHKAPDAEPLPDAEQDEDHKDVDTAPCAPARVTLPPCDMPEFDAIHLREEWDAIAPLLRACLTDRQRMIIELNFLGGLNLRQIADLIGYSRAYVHLQKTMALKKIRHRLIDQHNYFDRD